MNISEAMRVLSSAYTRDDKDFGFLIDPSPPFFLFSSSITAEDIASAWEAVRREIGEPVDNKSFEAKWSGPAMSD